MSNFTKMRILAFLFLITNSGSDLFAGWADYFDFSKLNTEAVGEKTKELIGQVSGDARTSVVVGLAAAAMTAYLYRVWSVYQKMNGDIEIDEPNILIYDENDWSNRKGIWAKWRKQKNVWRPDDIYDTPLQILNSPTEIIYNNIINDAMQGRLQFAELNLRDSKSPLDRNAIYEQIWASFKKEQKELLASLPYLAKKIEKGSGITFGDVKEFQAKIENELFTTFNDQVRSGGSQIGYESLLDLKYLDQYDIELRPNFIKKVCQRSGWGFGSIICSQAAGLFFDRAVALGRLFAIEDKLKKYGDVLKGTAKRVSTIITVSGTFQPTVQIDRGRPQLKALADTPKDASKAESAPVGMASASQQQDISRSPSKGTGVVSVKEGQKLQVYGDASNGANIGSDASEQKEDVL